MRVTNQHDIVPIVPPEAFGYSQVSGELHITSVDSASGAATMISCPGQENDVRITLFLPMCCFSFSITYRYAELRRWEFHPPDVYRRPLGSLLQRHLLRL